MVGEIKTLVTTKAWHRNMWLRLLRPQQVRKQKVIGLGFSWLSASFLYQLSPQTTYIWDGS